MRIMTAVWGENHLNWFERSCVASLKWNEEALKDATWTIFTKREDVKTATTLAGKVNVAKIEYVELPDSVEGNSPQMGAHLLSCLNYMMNVCIKENSKLLMAPPDTVFSQGSIHALRVAGRQKSTCVAVPHARVNPSVFGQIKETPLSGAELVSLAMKHGHKAWLEAEMGHPKQNSYVGGVAWQRIGEKIISVQHRLPTVYLCEFIPSDLEYFSRAHDGLPPTFGVWDHVWPTKLIGEGRQRMIGSSDAVCILEVTKNDLNVPPEHPMSPDEPDAYWRKIAHNLVNRQYLYIMREG